MAKFYAKAPDGTDATLSITVEGFTQSLQQNGWCKMPNGLILQWLTNTSSGSHFTTNFIINTNTTFYLSYIILGNGTYHGLTETDSSSMKIVRNWYNQSYPGPLTTFYLIISN